MPKFQVGYRYGVFVNDMGMDCVTEFTVIETGIMELHREGHTESYMAEGFKFVDRNGDIYTCDEALYIQHVKDNNWVINCYETLDNVE